MGFHRVKLGTLSIPSGVASARSNSLGAAELSRCVAIAFDNPAAFTGAIAVNVGAKEDTAAASHKPLDNNGTAVTLTANRYQRHEVNGFLSISVQTNGTEAAQRDIDVYAILTAGD